MIFNVLCDICVMNFCAVPVAILADLPPYTSDVEAMRSRPLTLFVKPMWEM